MSKGKEAQKGVLTRLLAFAGPHKRLTFLGCALSGASMVASMVPYVAIWLAARDLIQVAPDWAAATNVVQYGWIAFGFAIGGLVVYFLGLMCTHLAAFRTASNMRKQCAEHLMKTSLGYFDTHASGSLRRRIDGSAAATETMLAHNLADIVGTIVLFVGMVVLLLAFDWRMGLACLMAAVVSVVCMMSMMGGDRARVIAEFQASLEDLGKAGTEYVRGIPVVKIFQQTVYSFAAFRRAIETYSEKAQYFEGKICRIPQSINLTVTEGVFALLVPVVVLLAPAAADLPGFICDFAFYAVFSGIISTALARVMFAANGLNTAGDSLSRIEEVMAAPEMSVPEHPQRPADFSIEFRDVRFSYAGADAPAIDGISFKVPASSTFALVGPSGGGKTTAASLIPRFWDVDEGQVLVGGVDVRDIDPHELMALVSFAFQNDRLFRMSVFDNVAIARPGATRAQVEEALEAAQCADIVAKLPQGLETQVGSEGVHLSGGEQQRIALARAILKDSPIVVLDEATAFADPENEALIQKAIERLAEGRTVIMVAHRLSSVAHADGIVVLDRGRAVESGTHDELVRAGGPYARMWKDFCTAIDWKVGKEVS